MSRLDRAFEGAAARGKKLLVVYLCVGDPSIEESVEFARAALEAGADVLELGVPFSDPTADGPTIARASERAIARGSSLSRVLDAASRIRQGSDAPLVLFGYYNPILIRGEARAVEEAKRAGIDALLVVDLPPEEGAELRRAAADAGIAMVPLLTPTSGPERVRAAVARASGFVYYVSVTGVTGKAAGGALAAAAEEASRLREVSRLPVVVGFGIDEPSKARLAAGAGLSRGADGVVVGTAIVKAIDAAPDAPARRRAVSELVGRLRRALDD